MLRRSQLDVISVYPASVILSFSIKGLFTTLWIFLWFDVVFHIRPRSFLTLILWRIYIYTIIQFERLFKNAAARPTRSRRIQLKSNCTILPSLFPSVIYSLQVASLFPLRISAGPGMSEDVCFIFNVSFIVYSFYVVYRYTVYKLSIHSIQLSLGKLLDMKMLRTYLFTDSL